MNADHQKYTTLRYTPEAGSVLDALNGPEFKCNHEPGTHAKRAGGRDSQGNFVSAEASAYPEKLNLTLAGPEIEQGLPSPPSTLSSRPAATGTRARAAPQRAPIAASAACALSGASRAALSGASSSTSRASSAEPLAGSVAAAFSRAH